MPIHHGTCVHQVETNELQIANAACVHVCSHSDCRLLICGAVLQAQRAAADRATMPPPVTAVLPAAAAPAQPAIPRPAVPSGCFAPPAGVLLLVHKSGELLQQLPVTQVVVEADLLILQLGQSV